MTEETSAVRSTNATGRKLGWKEWALIIAIIYCVVMVLVAGVVREGSAGFYRNASIPVQELVQKSWGADGQHMPLVREFGSVGSDTPIICLGQARYDYQGRPWVEMRFMQGSGVSNVTDFQVPYERVKVVELAAGQSPYVRFNFDGGTVEVHERGYGYSFWRFLTLRGPAHYAGYEPGWDRHDTPADYLVPLVLDHVATVELGIPANDTTWANLLHPA